jgi:hypothetical protein
MARKKRQAESITPTDDVIAQAIAEGQALIAEGKTKVEAAMAIYCHLNESPQEVVLQAFIEVPPSLPRVLSPTGTTAARSCRRNALNSIQVLG